MKKIISIILAAAMCVGSITAFASEHYNDVHNNSPYANAIERLYDFGVMRGYEDGTFRPDRVVTRAEAAALMCAARNIHAEDIPDDIGNDTIILWNTGEVYTPPYETDKSDGFSDVDKNHWAYRFISYAAKTHPATIKGYGDGTFHPDDTVTYAEFVKMCVCLIGYDTFAAQMGYPHGYLSQAATLGLTDGLSARKNTDGITRADAAVILANTLEAPVMGMGEWQTNYLNGSGSYAPQVKDGTGEDYQNLLSIYFDIYKVTASVADPNATLEPVEDNTEIYEKAVADLTELKVLDKDFDPDAEITKGDFAKYARRLMYPSEADFQTQYDGRLTDVSKDRKDICLMLCRGYMSTKSGTEFGINDKITYKAAVKVLVKMVYGMGAESRYATYMDVAAKNGIAAKVKNSGKSLTGEELAIMLYNCLDKTIETVGGDNKMETAEDNTLRNKLLGGGGINKIADKGKKILDFTDVKIPIKGMDSAGASVMQKIGKVTVKENQDVIISLDDSSPAYVNYFVRVERTDGGLSEEFVDPSVPGDMLAMWCADAGEYDVYLGTTSAPVTVSGAIYVRETDRENY